VLAQAVFDQGHEVELSPIQEIQRQALIAGAPHINQPAIEAFLNRLKHSAHFLDFETFGTAIPLFDDVSPFEPVPFQYSLQVQHTPDAQPEHSMFLAGGTGDPRREFIERLRQTVDDHGSVIVFNAVFEKGVLTRCAELFPEFTSWVEKAKRRMLGLLTPFTSCHHYHPPQLGSASIK